MSDFQEEFPVDYDPNFDYATFKKLIQSVKLSHRSDHTLDDWNKFNYAETFKELKVPEIAWLEALDAVTNGKPHPYAQSDLSNIDYESNATTFNINDIPCNKAHLQLVSSLPRVSCDDLSIEEFREQYEKPGKPVMISGLTKDWPCKHWTFDSLIESKYVNARFRVGDDDSGRAIRIPLDDYMKYCRNNKDDSPLYLFEDAFDEQPIANSIVNEYSVPKYFAEDIFPILPFDRRPPFRWILVGSERSGTRMHLDPLDSSAWNVVLGDPIAENRKGRPCKRWCLMSPSLSADFAAGKMVWSNKERADGRSPQAIHWFLNILPRIRNYVQRTGRQIELMEFIQYEGEVVFVPSLWWHAVYNLNDNISLTQNWVSNTNFPAAWRAMRSRRTHMARRLIPRLKIFYPHLAKVAEEVNEADGYEWSYEMVSRTKKLGEDRRLALRADALAMCKSINKEKFKDSQLFDEDMKDILDVMMSGDSDSSGSSDNDSDSDDSDDSENEDDYE